MGWQQKESYVKSELQKLGGSGVYYDNGGARGSAATGMFDLEASEAQLRKLASNDYDRRESIKYGKDSGDKRFKDVGNGGFGSMTELVNADRAIAKYGYNELEHKNMSSDNDYAAVSESLFNKSRSGFAEQITANATQEDEQSDTAVMPTTTYETSPETVKARETVKDWEASNSGGDVYGTRSSTSSPAYGASTAPKRAITTNVDEFAQNFKNNVKDEMKFKPNIPV